MPPALAPRDTQVTWFPSWVFACAELPHTYATRDLSTPASGGSPFTTGVSQVGGTDLVGDPAGAEALHAWGRIIDAPTVSRRITDPLVPTVEAQGITLKVAEMLSGDYAAAPFTLSRYDEISGLRLYECHGIITQTTLDREGTTIEGTTVDRAILEEQVPVGVVDSATFPEAPAESIGRTIPWVFGNVTDLPLLCVRDDLVNSIFDYIVCRGEAAAITGLRRLSQNADAVPPQTEFPIDHIELEPYPGEDGVLVNGTMEDWPGVAVPDGWTLISGTVAKTITAGEVAEGSAAGALTRAAGVNAFLDQNLMANAPTLSPSWWQGREVTVRASVRATVASTTDLRLADSAGGTNSAFHTGGGTFEYLFPTRILDPATTSATVRCRIQTTNTTAQFDDVRVFLKAKSMAEILRTDLYPGYTAVRFYLRQEASSGALHEIVADVRGLQPERNPVRAIRTLLTDATHGIGQTVDAASFDAGEIAVSVTYESAILLDEPILFLPFRDPVPDSTADFVPISDRSGHARHGFAVNGGSGVPIMLGGPSAPSIATPIRSPFSNEDDAALALPAAGFGGTAAYVPSFPAFSGQTITVELWLQIYPGNLPFAGDRPILEKQVGAGALSGYGIYRETNNLFFFVRGVDAVLYAVVSPLINGTDEGRWMHVVGIATGGVLTLYRDGVLVATGSYSADIAEGDGRVLLGEWGIGLGGLGCDWIDNVALYATALPAARIAAHTAAVALDVAQPIVNYPQAQASVAPSPEVHYLLSEDPGSATMFDSSGNAHNGTYIGAPLLGVPGPLNPERGFVNGFGAARFANNVAQYAVETGMTLADAAGHLSAFYAPAAKRVAAGICEKTIGGVRGTQWSLCQRLGPVGWGVVRFQLITSGGTFAVDAGLTSQDKNRFSLYDATWGSGTMELYKNGALAAATTYTGTPVSGVGDFYIGVQGTVGGLRTRPAIGDIAHVSYRAAHMTAEAILAFWTAATWYNGGLMVDAALTEPRQLQDWLNEIGRLRGIRLDFTATGTITVSVDTLPTSILIDARDGVGDGDRNIVAISGRQKPRLEDRLRDLVIRYRRDLRTGEYLHTLRRPISTRVDANGRRIGRKVVFECPAIREHPTADRFADYAAKRLACEDAVTVTLHQEARRLMEGNLVQITDELMNYASTVMEARGVNKALETIEAELWQWDEGIFSYSPAAFPSDAGPG